jgi:hypothetical protein
MTEEIREDPPDQEVLDILNDLNAILSDLGPDQGLAGQTQVPAAAANPQFPIALVAPTASALLPPPRVSAPPPCVPPLPKPEAASVASQPAAEPLASAPAEPRNSPAEPVPRPVPPVKPPPPPSKPATGPAPATTPASLPQHGLPSADEPPAIPIPDRAGKDQIRRVAFLYLGKFAAVRDALAQSLDHTAQTVPKKPLYLRRVLYQAITEDCDGREVLSRVLQAKAAAVLGITEGLADRKLRQLSEIFSGAGIMFRSVAPLDAGKKSLAIDIVVDVMLLPPEAP